MQRMTMVLLIAGLHLGCDGVESNPGDAGFVDAGDTIDSGEPGPDAAPDAATLRRTAVYVEGVPGFAAPHLAPTKVPYSSEIVDELGEFDPVTHRFTAAAAGDYYVCASLYKGEYRPFLTLAVLKNEGPSRWVFAFNAWTPSGCTTVRLAAGDFIDVRVGQDSGGAYAFTADSRWSWLSIHRVEGLAFAETSKEFSADSGAFAVVSYGREVFDDANELQGAANRFVPSVSGDYQVCASAGGRTWYTFELDTFVNGGRQRGFGNGAAITAGCKSTRLTAGDVLEVRAYQASGKTVMYAPDPTVSWISVARRKTVAAAAIAKTFGVVHDTMTKVAYSAESLDESGEYDPAVRRFTARHPGDYQVCASVAHSVLTNPVELLTFKNGALDKGFALGTPIASGCRVVRLAAGEYVEVFAYQASGSTVSITADSYWSYLTIDRLD
jgi:hypothetical protein